VFTVDGKELAKVMRVEVRCYGKDAREFRLDTPELKATGFGLDASGWTAPKQLHSVFGAMQRFQKLFFHTPLVNVFIFGSEAYHDYYRWPMRDRKTFETWRATTEWGRLFERYAAGPISGVSK
jgi:hypothetical protein